ncbi:unnamed protein product, partial [Urochloa humidicola]
SRLLFPFNASSPLSLLLSYPLLPSPVSPLLSQAVEPGGVALARARPDLMRPDLARPAGARPAAGGAGGGARAGQTELARAGRSSRGGLEEAWRRGISAPAPAPAAALSLKWSAVLEVAALSSDVADEGGLRLHHALQLHHGPLRARRLAAVPASPQAPPAPRHASSAGRASPAKRRACAAGRAPRELPCRWISARSAPTTRGSTRRAEESRKNPMWVPR